MLPLLRFYVNIASTSTASACMEFFLNRKVLGRLANAQVRSTSLRFRVRRPSLVTTILGSHQKVRPAEAYAAKPRLPAWQMPIYNWIQF